MLETTAVEVSGDPDKYSLKVYGEFIMPHGQRERETGRETKEKTN